MLLPLVQVSVQTSQHFGHGVPVQSCRCELIGHLGSATLTRLPVQAPHSGVGEQPIVTV